jgi:hypothetical protein
MDACADRAAALHADNEAMVLVLGRPTFPIPRLFTAAQRGTVTALLNEIDADPLCGFWG